MSLRRALVMLHRWAGLFTALFLALAGFTGALIAWDHELDAALNPDMLRAQFTAAAPSPLQLAQRLERADPRLRVSYLPLAHQPGHALLVSVEARAETAPASVHSGALDFDQVALDPASGAIKGRRLWGEFAFRRANVLPFLYKLHYTLQWPRALGFRAGVWFMGIVALVWMIDGLVALAIAVPSRKHWRRSFAFRFKQGGARLTFDLHRSGGVWLSALTLVFAVTAVSMNLRREVVEPVVGLFSSLAPDPLERGAGPRATVTQRPALSREQAVEVASARAKTLGIAAPPGAIFHAAAAGVYGVGFFAPGRDHGDGGLGNSWLYLDAFSGAPLGELIPGQGSAGDVLLQAQFPLHSGRLFGLAGRIAVSVLGLLVTALSVTGILIWARRRAARAARSAAEGADVVVGRRPPLSSHARG